MVLAKWMKPTSYGIWNSFKERVEMDNCSDSLGATEVQTRAELGTSRKGPMTLLLVFVP